ncbi:MAG: hypothetical protein FJ279_33840, partial [Planctomycetes bacterium]|nr:hypothetical protein [Planctomycetota bacterium]
MLLRAFAVGEGKVQDVTRFCGTRRQRWSARQIIHRAYSPEINRLGHPHWRTSFGDNRFALSWQPPTPGEYALVGVVVKTTTGSHPDILRPESIRRFIELSYEPYFQRYGAEFGKLIKGAFTDEPSPGGPLYPWTPRFPEEFRADHGYDVLDHLAHLALDIDERSAAVRHHFRLTQHRLQCQAYTGQIGRWCEQHGILAVGHLTRTEWLSLVAAWWPNELRCYKPMHIPSADPLGATCAWAEAAAYHTGLKVASSAAHLFGRAQAGSDALAVIGDEAALRDLKFIMDYQMVLGINHFSVHGLSYSLDGPRKDEVPPSLFYQHTEWKHSRHLLDHVRTTCEALTGGEHLCELAVLYPSTSLACQARPEADWHRLPDEPLIHALVEQLLSHQRDFDFIDEVTLQETVDEEGNLTTPEPYRVILLPHLRYLDERTADALLRFAATGGRVIAVGTTPKAITRSLEKPLREWAGGMIQRCPSLTDDVLRTLPGVEVSGAGGRDVFVLRRRVGGERRMFVFNRREQAFDGQVDGCPVSVPPRGSVLVTANLPLRKAEREVPGCLADLSAGWDVTFEPNQLPLNFWHASATDRARLEAAPTNPPGFDLMARQADPMGEGDGRVCYVCRFMLTGDIPDARLVM